MAAVFTAIGTLIREFRQAPPTPASTYSFETKLHASVLEIGRVIMECTLNNVEPATPEEAPPRLDFEGQEYRRKPKSYNRDLGTLFGSVQLERLLYEPLERGEKSIFPLEINLGVVARRATPALAERVAEWATQQTQDALRAIIERDHHLTWSVNTLRNVTAAASDGMAPQLHAAQVAQLLKWLDQADRSRGKHRVTLSVGRDGIFLPLRDEENYKDGAVATVSVHDRRGKRLGTVYLGRMPEAFQITLSDELTRLVQDVLRQWSGSRPRLVYVTDAGFHPTWYFNHVLRSMRDPKQPKRYLEWTWIVDFYHASQYVSKLAESLFGDTREGKDWARKMCKWLKHKPKAVYRVLHSAARYHSEKHLSNKAEKTYQGAYAYLNEHSASMDYAAYRARGLPIGSGVTEAACKTVFTQRFKQSGMTWGVEHGQRILNLRLTRLSHVWSRVYAAYLALCPTITMETELAFSKILTQKAA
ncbi:MAG TPA: hypothetical protein VMV69_13635 [Pirellulales bacterium]|nr:hypothetical protein [Pirellulales bacterium]